jgi:hypothetical protein
MPHSSMVISGAVPGTAPCLAVIAARSYRLQNGSRATALPEEITFSRTSQYERSTNGGAGNRLVEEAIATVVAKPLTDVLVRGTARSLRGAVTTLETGVRVGGARKAVRVIGDRQITIGQGGGPTFSAPRPFVEMRVTWDHAYGGRDMHAERRFQQHPGRRSYLGTDPNDLMKDAQVSYPRNAAGRGYYLDLDRSRLNGVMAPNLEDPTDPVTPDRLLSSTTVDWIDRPVAACYEPIDVFTFPRAAFLLRPAFDTPERPIHELAAGALFVEDLQRKLDLRGPGNPRVFNCAPAGLAVCRLEGAERASLWNMHAQHEQLEFDLPDDRPRLLIEPPGVAPRELTPLLQTVLIEPDRDRVTLTWTGVLPVAMPYPDEMVASMRHAVVWSR